MRRFNSRMLLSAVIASLAIAGWLTPQADSMCGYFRPIIIDLKQPSEMLQPSQIAFITWDPESKVETVTVQPKFEGNALDFGMVIPTPSQPKLHEMPRDFFKSLAVFSILKKREFPQSKLLPVERLSRLRNSSFEAFRRGGDDETRAVRKKTVVVLEAGVVGS